MTFKIPLLTHAAAALSLLLCACVTTPPDTALEDARVAVRAVESNPDVARVDGVDLAMAQQELANAENAAEHDARDMEDHEASLAVRTAKLAQLRTDEMLARTDADRDTDPDAVDSQTLAAAATVRELRANFATLSAQPTVRGLMLVLTDDYFDPGRAGLRAPASRILDGLAGFLIAHPERRVRVEGHADGAGTPGSDLMLSLQRAETVRRSLVARGVDPLRSDAVGYGPGNPLLSAASSADDPVIHGVEILLSDAHGQIASR